MKLEGLKILTIALCFSLFPIQASANEPVAPNSPDLRLRTIVIDAGHGGKDPGTVSSDRKTYEKTLTLKISKAIAQKIRNAYPDVNVLLTRDNDSFVSLAGRARTASANDAQFFISVHINAASKSKSANGFAAYILGPSTSYDSYDINMEVCKRENSVIYLEDDYSTTYKGYDASPEAEILLQLMQNSYREQSLLFAEAVSSSMSKGPFNANLGVRQGNFQVLREASMPAVLLEFGFMSNASDLAILRSEQKLDAITDNVLKAFKEYKKNYDESVSLDTRIPETVAEPAATVNKSENLKAAADTTKPAEQAAEPEKEAAPAAVQNEGQHDECSYGIQVLASERLMMQTDKYFKGHPVKIIKSGTLYKYVLCLSEDKEAVVKNSVEIFKEYPGSFLVRIEGSNVILER